MGRSARDGSITDQLNAEPSTEMPSERATIEAVVEAARDPLFEDTVTTLRAVAELPTPELERLAQLTAEDPSAEDQLRAAGLDVQQQMERAAILDELVARLGLAELDPSVHDSILGGATMMMISSDVKINGVEYQLNPIEGSYMVADPACERACNRATLRRIAQAIWDYMRALSRCGGIGCALRASLAYVAELADATRDQSQCLADCPEVALEDIHCASDSDCDPDEFCHRSGVNDCRPRHGERHLCTRHAHCLSNCCKPHISAAGLPICRPANRCD